MAAASWKKDLQKGDKRVSGNWNQQWNGSKWISTRKVTPAASSSASTPAAGSTTTPATTGGYEKNDPLYGSKFLSPKQQRTAAVNYVDQTMAPESDIINSGSRQLEGAKNIGLGVQASGESLQKSLGAALGALAGNTAGMTGGNVYAGTQGAQLMQADTPMLENRATVAGVENKIGQTTRDLLTKRADDRRVMLADRLNEMYKRQVDKSTAREQSDLTRETLGTKKDIAAATIAAQDARFQVTTDIQYKRLEQAQQRLDKTNAKPSAYLTQAHQTIKDLLGAKTQSVDQTMGHVVTVRDPAKGIIVRKWYPGNWEAVQQAAANEFGPELQRADVVPQGDAKPNPSGTKVSSPKYNREQVLKAMVPWIVANVAGYTKATATAWVKSQPEMQIAS
jgi:hypothetical protein